MRMSAPRHDRGLGRVVIGEVVFGDFNGLALRKVAKILIFQGIRVIFGVPRDKDLSAVLGGYRVHARALGRSKNF